MKAAVCAAIKRVAVRIRDQLGDILIIEVTLRNYWLSGHVVDPVLWKRSAFISGTESEGSKGEQTRCFRWHGANNKSMGLAQTRIS